MKTNSTNSELFPTAVRTAMILAAGIIFFVASPRHASAQGLNWEGQTGAFITPFAYTMASPAKGVARPQVSFHYLDTGNVVGGYMQTSVTTGMFKRVEFGYTRTLSMGGTTPALSPLFEGGFNTVHGKVNLIPENTWKKKYMPAISWGFVARTQVRHVGGVLSAKDTSNGDLYMVATKTVTQVKGLPFVVSLGFKQTNASLFGIAGNLFIADGGNFRIRKVDTSGIITTVAGNGSSEFSGDGGPATSASLTNPFGVALDGTGNLFIADEGSNRIRKVDTSGIITTVAGNGSSGFSGDGGPAISASLSGPIGVALDGTGNLFFADAGNNRIRKVDTSGIISTVAGDGIFGFSGDGDPATSASLRDPFGVALDGAGNLFIADRFNQRIRRVDAATGIITTVAGDGPTGIGAGGFSGDGGPATSASLNSPFGVAVDGAGNLFIADTLNNRIRKVDTSGIITTVAGNGSFGFSGDGDPATSASLHEPFGVALDGSGNLFIASLTGSTNASAAWTLLPASSPRWRATAPRVLELVALVATAARPPAPACTSPTAWPWMAVATSSSLTL